MAITNAERVGKALELVREGVIPFVERELKAELGSSWEAEVEQSLHSPKDLFNKDNTIHWDPHRLLLVMWNFWNSVFTRTLGQAERTLVSELRNVRNDWAHSKPFTSDDAYRALDSTHRLLTAISAPQALEAEKVKMDLLRVRFDEQARQQTRKKSAIPTESQPQGDLRPWREIVTPHPDVASGNFQLAEFAADLDQVYRGGGGSEYQDPPEFFQRTYLTDGLRQLLKTALNRLSGNKAVDPVVELQTNFGGGKTHSLLALYHLFSGAKPKELLGVEELLREIDMETIPPTRRAVLVGTRIEPGSVHKKADGCQVHTLWGELAWQLAGKEGYEFVADSDRHGTNPGDALRKLFEKFSPCLILIDEWVAYFRALWGKHDLPAGTFATHQTFAQALTETVKEVPGTLLVAALPQSEIEVGGEAGAEALKVLSNTIKRIEAPWRPATQDESFEIVRRRLFQPINDPGLFTQRDTVVRAFRQYYQQHSQEFPPEAKEGSYERRMKAAYPIHPELFERLYEDWGSLERFQRTRGVLRWLATVIHTLWERNDASLLIMPGTVPLDDGAVQRELVNFMEDNWVPVIEKDVDGPHSLPLEIDRAHSGTLGRYSATRRVARTIYIGSAPTLHAAKKGLDDRNIRLGCTQPGEVVATFGDALRRLSDQATHLYVDGGRYWFDTQASVTRLAQDRASQLDIHDVWAELKKRIGSGGGKGNFSYVHPMPVSNNDVPDDQEARLVIIGPENPHQSKNPESEARKQAAGFLENRGAGPRLYKNTLIFLAPDEKRLAELERAVRQYLAWKSIENEKEALDLGAFQAGQAKTKREQSEEAIKQRIPEAFRWLLVPVQYDPKGTMEWEEQSLNGQGTLAERASKKLDKSLIKIFGGGVLRHEMDKVPLWRGDHVSIQQLTEDYAQYLYLSRLVSPEVLTDAVRDGAMSLTWEETGFAVAERWDEKEGRYVGLQVGSLGMLHPKMLVVKPEVAARQFEQEKLSAPGPSPIPGQPDTPPTSGTPTDEGEPAPQPLAPKRFHGTVVLDPKRVTSDAGKVAQEIIQHIAAELGSDLTITLEIDAVIPKGASDHVIRTVTENCRTLNFSDYGFEEE